MLNFLKLFSSSVIVSILAVSYMTVYIVFAAPSQSPPLGGGAITVDSAGEVGIGTNNPQAPLHVVALTDNQIKVSGSAGSGAGVEVRGATPGADSFFRAYDANTGTDYGILMGHSSTGGGTWPDSAIRFITQYTGTGTPKDIVFNRLSSGNAAEIMRLKPDGNVCIGGVCRTSWPSGGDPNAVTSTSSGKKVVGGLSGLTNMSNGEVIVSTGLSTVTSAVGTSLSSALVSSVASISGGSVTFRALRPSFGDTGNIQTQIYWIAFGS